MNCHTYIFREIKCIILTCFTDIFSFSNSASCRTSSALESSIFLWLRASSLRSFCRFPSIFLNSLFTESKKALRTLQILKYILVTLLLMHIFVLIRVLNKSMK